MSSIPTIGDVVREWRRYRQISLTDFCQQTQLSKGYISELEHNKIGTPKQDKVKKLAPALGISEMDILSRRMPPEVEGQGDNKGAQAAAQVVPAHQPPAVAGIEASVLQQILTLLQVLTTAIPQLTAVIAQFQAVAELKQLRTDDASNTIQDDSEDEGVDSSEEPSPEEVKAVKDVIVAAGQGNVESALQQLAAITASAAFGHSE